MNLAKNATLLDANEVPAKMNFCTVTYSSQYCGSFSRTIRNNQLNPIQFESTKPEGKRRKYCMSMIDQLRSKSLLSVAGLPPSQFQCVALSGCIDHVHNSLTWRKNFARTGCVGQKIWREPRFSGLFILRSKSWRPCEGCLLGCSCAGLPIFQLKIARTLL